jgi:phosphate:Na+ symporter
MIRQMIFELIGGLGMFLFGMSLMGDGLQKAAGDRMRRILEVLTVNPLMGIIAGLVVTMLIQSSSATTVILVSFINAGLLTLHQAIGVIMGAAIGTTITAQIIAFKLNDYALPAIGLGMILYLFARKRQLRNWGQIILGFGFLFLGMTFMSGGMKPLQNMPWFTELMTRFSHVPILGVFAGAGLTAIVQSSSATIGILQALGAYGLVSLPVALPILFGDNIGTTATGLLASIGTTVGARRAAVFHLVFKCIGTLLFLPALPLFITVVSRTSTDIVRQIANAHTMFNVAATVILFPLSGLMVRFVEKLVPGEEMKILERDLKFLNERIQSTPSIALGQVVKELARMTHMSLDALQQAVDSFLRADLRQAKMALQTEGVINELEHGITTYLVALAQKSLTEEQSERLTGLLEVTSDVERIGDLAENIAEFAEYRIDASLPMTEVAIGELNEMYDIVKRNIERCIKALENDDLDMAREVLVQEKAIDQMEKELRRNHMMRLNVGLCNPSSGIIFLDVISNLERIGDHTAHMANIILGNE